ncbi:Transcriptional regulator [Sulfitobacter noctilucicola]|nr:GntR family transcriptional regulator [Sulfitobacter noctilucicola]KIN64076.1 Transcriptional regulator [Sulfitobacter noctilucicola]
MMDGASRPPAAESAYDILRSRILSGDLGPGERLVEQSLAKDLGLSRTPVREAIRRLLHEGFVEKGQGYSTRVADFHDEELAQLFEIRRRLECYAAGRAAKMATPDEVALLRKLSDEMAAHTPPANQEDYDIISTANTEFHRTLYEAARSPRLTALITSAVDVGVVARTYHSYSPADLERSARHHTEIVDAVEAQAPEWAESVMSSHVLAAAASAFQGRKDAQDG